MGQLRQRLKLRTAIAVGLGGTVLLALAAMLHGMVEAAGIAGEARWEVLALGVGSFLVATAMAGLRFRAMVPDHAQEQLPSGARLARLFVAANALNVVLPGPAGDLALAAALERRWGLQLETGVAAALHARFVGLLVTGVLAVVFALVLPLPAAVAPLVTTGVAGLGLLAMLGGSVAFRADWLRGLSGWTSTQLPPWRRLHPRVVRLCDALEAVVARGWRARLAAAGWSLLIQGWVFLAFLAAAASGGVVLEWVPALLTHATAGVAAVGAVLLPAGGAGGYELPFALVLGATSELSVPAVGLVLVLMRLVHLFSIGFSALVLLVEAPELLTERAALASES